jgi:alkanesulfonate monooxygenase SsuD/methylene tetrahydromethanopterin reductase-like flavin-dependent oxidoreductase (luciferase family)
MKFGITIPAFGKYADPLYLAEVATEAEKAGWDGFFIWDQLIFDEAFHSMNDPFVSLAAVALKTEHMKVGIMVTPLPRRRPWVVARQAVTLDMLSQGRFILGVGLGNPPESEFGYFNEEQDSRIRAQKLNEGIDILYGLWSGEPFSYDGSYYSLSEMIFLPKPLQANLPVWVGGGWNRKGARMRAARCDGFFPGKREMLTLDEWCNVQAAVESYRTKSSSCTWVHGGKSDVTQDESIRVVQQYADFGIDWWVEEIDAWRYGHGWFEPWNTAIVDTMNQRIFEGPPRS